MRDKGEPFLQEAVAVITLLMNEANMDDETSAEVGNRQAVLDRAAAFIEAARQKISASY